MTPRIPRALSIAGSDSGGGAGIQADLKAFARAGVHGMTAITALTAQNTVGVSSVHLVPPEVIIEQVQAVVNDIGVDAVKIGMVGAATSIEAVARSLELLPVGIPIVLDPVMVAESGAPLLDPGAREALIELLVPHATVITPNLPEARALAGDESHLVRAARDDAGGSSDAAEELARRLHTLGPGAVIVTGGHRDQATDVLFDGREIVEIPGERHPEGAAHGSGCTHSSLLAARLAAGDDLITAARAAKSATAEAIRDGLFEIGAGAGPVDVLGLRARQAGWPALPGPRRQAEVGPLEL